MIAVQKNKENKEHKQKITVNITLKGIRILDETTEVGRVFSFFFVFWSSPEQRIIYSSQLLFTRISKISGGYKLGFIKFG